MNIPATVITAVLCFGITALLGFVAIPALRKLKFGQTILDIGPAWHKSKNGTPTTVSYTHLTLPTILLV